MLKTSLKDGEKNTQAAARLTTMESMYQGNITLAVGCQEDYYIK